MAVAGLLLPVLETFLPLEMKHWPQQVKLSQCPERIDDYSVYYDSISILDSKGAGSNLFAVSSCLLLDRRGHILQGQM